MTLAEKIQTLRKEKGLSQDQLALELGVSRQSVSKWELGDSMPDIAKILQLADYFQVSTDYLLREEIETPAPAPLFAADASPADTLPADTLPADTPATATKSKPPFLRAAKICLVLTILCIIVPIGVSYLNKFLNFAPRLGSNEFILIFSVILLRIVPVTAALTILFWILYHIKK